MRNSVEIMPVMSLIMVDVMIRWFCGTLPVVIVMACRKGWPRTLVLEMI